MIRQLTSRARRGASTGAARALLLTAASPAAALADDAGADRDDARGRRSGFSFDLRFGAGLARAEITERDRSIVDLNAYTLGGAMRFGTFLSPRVLIGAELALSWAADAGELRVRDADYFSGDPLPRSASYGSFSPLGVFVEVYPWEREGFFFGATAGVGMMDLPSFADGGGGVMAGFALELGYELGGAGKRGPALYLRHFRWAGEEVPLSSDHPDGVVSRELLIGLRWSFWSALWHPPAPAS